jgi:hypothetical protein
MSDTTSPRRPAVHERTVEGYGTVRIVPVDPHADAAVIHGWTSDPRARFWGMNGLSRDQVAAVYAHLAGLDTHHAFLATRDGDPVALLQTYDPAADRVGECYPVRPGDIGVHLLLAPAGPGGALPGWTGHLTSVIADYALLGLGRRRIVVDPDVRNAPAIARFTRMGFETGPAVTLPRVDLPDGSLPEKRAQLAFLRAETFYPG